MNHFPNKHVLFFVAIVLITACGNISNEAEKKLNELKSKTESLDSLINKEVDKVLTLDSLIDKENEKVKKLDTLINKSSSRLDSMAKKGSRYLEKITK